MTRPRAILWTAVSTQAQADDEKASLPAQEADLRALAEKHGWEVIDVLRVPGHSRRYIDWHELVRDSLKANIDSFDRLKRHIDRRDFDVLAVRDADRFARTQTLHAYIVESVIEAGAIIWSLSDGKVDDQNFRMFIAMSGYKAAGAIDQLMKYKDMALNAKPEKGLPVTGQEIWSHIYVRNEIGKVVRVIVDEQKRRAFNDLADLILAGVHWEDIGRIMNERGYRKNDGSRFSPTYFRRMVCHPVWWGHAARHFRGRETGRFAGPWTFDPGYPMPEGIRIWRDVYPAVWSGDVAEAVKAELRRRHALTRGRPDTENTRRFAGITVCADCGYALCSKTARGYLGLRCTNQSCRPGERKNSISERAVIAFLTPLLRELKTAGDPDRLFGDDSRAHSQQMLELARADLERVRQKARAVTRLFAENAGSPLEDVYATELQALSAEAVAIEATIQQEELTVALSVPRRAALDELDVDTLWGQPPRVINQTLHAIFGQWRLAVGRGKIMGYARGKTKRHRRPKQLIPQED